MFSAYGRGNQREEVRCGEKTVAGETRGQCGQVHLSWERGLRSWHVGDVDEVLSQGAGAATPCGKKSCEKGHSRSQDHIGTA